MAGSGTRSRRRPSRRTFSAGRARDGRLERLSRDWYGQDERLHGALRDRAENELAAITTPDQLAGASGTYRETTWELGEPELPGRLTALIVDEAEWSSHRARLAECEVD